MPGCALTFELLATTDNRSGLAVLAAALKAEDAAIRSRAVNALSERGCAKAGRLILEHWSRLSADDASRLIPKSQWLAPFARAALDGNESSVVAGLQATRVLRSTDFPDSIVTLAETGKSHSIREEATRTVDAIASEVGHAMRIGRSHAPGRSRLVFRLLESVRRYSMHQNDALVDAYLIASTWADSELRRAFEPDSPSVSLLLRRLADSSHAGPIEILASSLRRRDLSDTIAGLILSREDEGFRDALLRKVGKQPSRSTIANLRRIGLPACCRGGMELARSLAPEHLSAFLHVLAATSDDWTQTLTVACFTLRAADEDVVVSVPEVLNACPDLPVSHWMEAAKIVADGDDASIEGHPTAGLLMQLVELLDHPEPRLVEAARKVLDSMHAKSVLPIIRTLGKRSRRILGRVVVMIDSDAIHCVRDSLRHPVLQRRIEAILATDAFSAIDLLADSLAHIVRNDHQEARRVAAQVLADGTGDESLKLLQEMSEFPESTVRDTARASLEKRRADSREFPPDVQYLCELNLH